MIRQKSYSHLLEVLLVDIELNSPTKFVFNFLKFSKAKIIMHNCTYMGHPLATNTSSVEVVPKYFYFHILSN